MRFEEDPQEELSHLPVPFAFKQHEIRTAVDIHGLTWWWAVDVYRALDIKWSGAGTSLRNMPSDWFCTLNFRGQRGLGDVVLLSERGLYRVLMRSNSPISDAMCDWLAGDVLPAIRKQGFYGVVAGRERAALSAELRRNLKELNGADAFARKLLIMDTRCLCNLLGYPMPDIALIGADPDQLTIEGF